MSAPRGHCLLTLLLIYVKLTEGKRELNMNKDISRILVVDDNEVSLMNLTQTLQSLGEEPVQAKSGKAGLVRLSQYRVCLIITDYMMPEMNGAEFIQKAKQMPGYENVPVIMLSGDSGELEEVLNDGYGINDFLEKPVEKDKLDAVIKKYITGKDTRNDILTANPEAKKATDAPPDNTSYLQDAEQETVKTDNVAGNDESASETKESLNATLGLANFCGNLPNYLETLKIFAGCTNEKITRIKELLKRREYDGYTVEVHGLKGEAGIVGAAEISERARQLETCGKIITGSYKATMPVEECLKTIEEDTPALLEKYLNLAKEITEMLSPEANDNTEKVSEQNQGAENSLKEKSEKIKRYIAHAAESIESGDKELALNWLSEITDNIL